MPAYQYLQVKQRHAIATVTLNRPEVHNAFNDRVVAEVSQAFQELADDASVRVIVLAGAGKSFSAGADLSWMRQMIDYTPEENLQDARLLADMFRRIDRSPKPVIARIQGVALGGGAGLVAVADLPIAGESAQLGFTEVRLGILPAVISPYVVARIGMARAREYFLTGERFSATRAAEIGLVARVVADAELDNEVERTAGEILSCGPEALRETKKLLFQIAAERDEKRLQESTARAIAERRASSEGQEGMRAFLDKRPANWAERLKDGHS